MAGEAGTMTVAAPDTPQRAPRPVVGALIGGEVGAAVGLLFFGSTMLAPLGLAVAGAAVGPVAGAGLARIRRRLVQRAIREQLRRNHPAPGPPVAR
jgi:hypothetical protein